MGFLQGPRRARFWLSEVPYMHMHQAGFLEHDSPRLNASSKLSLVSSPLILSECINFQSANPKEMYSRDLSGSTFGAL